jgi:hypothetical protein
MAIFRQLPREAGPNGTEARTQRLHSEGKKSEPLVFAAAGTSDALVHQELDVGGDGVAHAHRARRGNAAKSARWASKQREQ